MDLRNTLLTIRSFFISIAVLALIAAISSPLVRSTQPEVLEEVLASGELRVISTNGATTFYEGSNGLTGFEYTLLKDFADSLGVNLVIENQPDNNALLKSIENRQYHFGSAELTASESQHYSLEFSAPYAQITQQLIFNGRLRAPTSIRDLYGKKIFVLADASHRERISYLQKRFPNVGWLSLVNLQMIDIMEMVHKGEIDYAVIDSNAYELNR